MCSAPCVIISRSSSLLAASAQISYQVVTVSKRDNHTLRGLRTPLLDDQLVQPQLLGRAFKHTLLDTALRNETEDINLLGLTDTMGTVHGLQVGLRVPVTVIQNDNVGGCEVDTQTTSASREQEDELLAVWLVVLVDSDNTVFVGSPTIDTTVLCENVSICIVAVEVVNLLYCRNRQ